MTDHPPSATEPEFVPLARYADMGSAFDEALVVLAMRLPCEVDAHPDGGYQLLAEPAHTEQIAAELACYREEQAIPPPTPVSLPLHGPGSVITALWVVVVAWSFWMQTHDVAWTARGLLDPVGLLDRGEWWRPFTALFLHADPGHLLGNTVSGALFFTWVSRSLGAARGWPLVLAAGTLGNFINALVHQGEPFSSLGASTAVFGALGVLTGNGLHHSLRGSLGRMLAQRLLPLVGGITLLSLTGAGSDPRTDATAHVLGFAAGLVLGWAATLVRRELPPETAPTP